MNVFNPKSLNLLAFNPLYDMEKLKTNTSSLLNDSQKFSMSNFNPWSLNLLTFSPLDDVAKLKIDTSSLLRDSLKFRTWASLIPKV